MKGSRLLPIAVVFTCAHCAVDPTSGPESARTSRKASAVAVQAAVTTNVLFLQSTVTGGVASIEADEVTRQGFTPVVLDGAAWSELTAEQFASYRAIVLGDPTCASDDDAPIAPAIASAAVWGAAVNGNVIIAGSDPVFHASQGGERLTRQSIDFALAQPGQTGAYVALSCYYHFAGASTPLPVLDGIRPNGFSVRGNLNCYNNAHIVARHPALDGLTDANLSNWSCSVHEALDRWPADFTVLAIAKDFNNSFTASDGTQGPPYIVASGAGLRSFPLSASPKTGRATAGSNHAVTAQLLDVETSEPVAGEVIGFAVTSGPNAGTTGVCSNTDCTTAENGQVIWTYHSNGQTGDDVIVVFVDRNHNGTADVGEPQTTAAMTWIAVTPLTLAGFCAIDRGGGPPTQTWIVTNTNDQAVGFTWDTVELASGTVSETGTGTVPAPVDGGVAQVMFQTRQPHGRHAADTVRLFVGGVLQDSEPIDPSQCSCRRRRGNTSGSLIEVSGGFQINQDTQPLPAPWLIPQGTPSDADNSASYDATAQIFSLTSNGCDIHDSSEFVYSRAQTDWHSVVGDAQIIASVQSLTAVGGGSPSSNAQAGIMFRSRNTPNADFVALVVTAGGSVILQASGASPVTLARSAPVELKLVRVGDVFRGYVRNSSGVWTQVGQAVTVRMPADAVLGLAAASAPSAGTINARFGQVQVSTRCCAEDQAARLSGVRGVVGSNPFNSTLINDYKDVLALLVYGESVNGTIPLEISDKKIWALLNKITYDGVIGRFAQCGSLFYLLSWRSPELPIIDIYINLQNITTITCPLSQAIVDMARTEFSDLVTYVNNNLRNNPGYLAIRTDVDTIYNLWIGQGTNSSADPTHGAQQFHDLRLTGVHAQSCRNGNAAFDPTSSRQVECALASETAAYTAGLPGVTNFVISFVYPFDSNARTLTYTAFEALNWP